MANKNLQGITLKIDGDTTALSKALNNLNKDIDSVDKELKNVNQALKLDPGNAEQVARKLELLGEKSDLAEKKVEALKAAQKQMDAEGVDKNTKAYQDLSTELVKAEGSYRDIATQMDRTKSSFDEVTKGSKQLETFLKATGQTADDLTSILGSKLVDAIKSGQLRAEGYQAVLDKLSTSFTGSKNNAEEFRKVLSSIDDGASLDQVRQGLEQISNASSNSKTSVSALGSEFDALKAKTQGIDSELKAINQSLKLDPSSIELCAQKQEVLSQGIESTESQLQILKQRYNELSAQGLDLGDEEFRSVQREITNTEASLSGYKSQLSDLENAQNRLNTYFEATGTSARDFANVLGSDLVAKIERGEASSQELANAFDKVGASALENTGDIDKLKTAIDSVDSGVSFDKIRGELNQLGGEFKESESDVDKFKSTLESIADSTAATAISEISDKVGELGDQLSEFGESWIETAGEAESSQSKIQMSLGMTAEEAEKMSDHVQNVLNNAFGESAEQVTDVMVRVKRSIQDVNEANIEDITEKFITLEDMGIDNEAAISAVNSAMQAFHMSSSEALDYLTAGFQRINDPANELGDIINEYAPHFAQAGYSGSEMMSVLEAGGAAGARSLDLVADLIKEMGIRLSDGSIADAVQDLDSQFEGMGVNFQGVMDDMTAAGASPKEIFEALVGEINKLPTDMDKAGAASTLFGTQAEDALLPAMNAIVSTGDGYLDVAGKAGEARDANSTAVGDMEAKWRELGKAFAPIGEDLAELATQLLEAVIPVVQKVVEWFENMPEPVKKVIEVVWMLVAAFTTLAPVLSVVWKAVKKAWDIFKNFEKLKKVWDIIKNGVGIFKTLWSAVQGLIPIIEGLVATIGGPMLAVIGVVIAAIIGLIAYFNNWGGCADWINEKWSQFISWLTDVFNGLVETVGGAWNSFTEFIKSVWDGLWSGIESAWDAVSSWFSGIFDAISETVGGAWNTFTQGITDAWNNIWSGIQSAWETVSGWFSGIFDAISETLGPAWETFTQGIADAWNMIWSGIQEGWEAITEWFTNIFQGLSDIVTTAWTTLTTTVTDLWNNIWTGIQTAWDTISEWFNTIFTGLTETVGAAWTSFTGFISDAWSTLWSGVQALWDTVSGWFSSAFEGVKSTVSGIWDSFCSGVQNTWDTLCTKVQDAWNTAKDKVTDIAENVRSTVSDKYNELKSKVSEYSDNIRDKISVAWENIRSKSSETWENIRSTVSEKMENLRSSCQQIMDNVKSFCQQTWEDIKNKASEAWENVRSTVTQKAEDIRSNLAGKWNEVVSNFTQAWDGLKQKASEIWENIKATVRGGVDALKNMMNFNWELPKIKLPHFSISGEFSLNPPSIPSISVDWYAKGGILTKPTIFGANGSTLLGGGEAGPEAILPIDKLDAFINENGNSKEVSEKLDTLITLMSQFCQTALNQETQIVLDNGTLVGQLAPGMDRELGMLQQRRIRR